jgi:hypothetical protein
MEAASTVRSGGLGEPSGGGGLAARYRGSPWRRTGEGGVEVAAGWRRRGRETAVRRSSASASSRRWD